MHRWKHYSAGLLAIACACPSPLPCAPAAQCPRASSGPVASVAPQTLAEQQVPDGCETVALERVVAMAITDFNQDGQQDRAYLLEPDEDAPAKAADGAELVIFLSDPQVRAEGRPRCGAAALRKPGAAWMGLAWGTMPELRTTSLGSLVVVSQNEAIGRNRWQAELTVAYRNGVFVVAGYTHSERDTLDPKAHSRCEVNFLTGAGVSEQRKFSVPVQAIPLLDWSEADVPKACSRER